MSGVSGLSGAVRLLQSVEVTSSVATVDFIDLPLVPTLLMMLDDLALSGTGQVGVMVSDDNGATWQGGGTEYNDSKTTGRYSSGNLWSGYQLGAGGQMYVTQQNGAQVLAGVTNGISGQLFFNGWDKAAAGTRLSFIGGSLAAANQVDVTMGHSEINIAPAAQWNGVRFTPSIGGGGTIDGGVIKVYGVQ